MKKFKEFKEELKEKIEILESMNILAESIDSAKSQLSTVPVLYYSEELSNRKFRETALSRFIIKGVDELDKIQVSADGYLSKYSGHNISDVGVIDFRRNTEVKLFSLQAAHLLFAQKEQLLFEKEQLELLSKQAEEVLNSTEKEVKNEQIVCEFLRDTPNETNNEIEKVISFLKERVKELKKSLTEVKEIKNDFLLKMSTDAINIELDRTNKSLNKAQTAKKLLTGKN